MISAAHGSHASAQPALLSASSGVPMIPQPKPAMPAWKRELELSQALQQGIVPHQKELKQAQAQAQALAMAEMLAQTAVTQAPAEPHTPPQPEPLLHTPPQTLPQVAPEPTSPTTPTSPQQKPCGTLFGTHRLRTQYSASAPDPSPSLQNAAPARAHNNTSPAAVEVKPTDAAQDADNKGEPPSGDASAEVASGDASVPNKVGMAANEGQVLNISTELQAMDSPAQARRAAKAYTFFTTAAPRPAPLPGEQLVNCMYCGIEQRATDRFAPLPSHISSCCHFCSPLSPRPLLLLYL